MSNKKKNIYVCVYVCIMIIAHTVVSFLIPEVLIIIYIL